MAAKEEVCPATLYHTIPAAVAGQGQLRDGVCPEEQLCCGTRGWHSVLRFRSAKAHICLIIMVSLSILAIFME